MATSNRNSMDTILTFNRDASQWSIVWSTAHIPGMDNASGGNVQNGIKGRRNIRLGSLALGAFLTMHCRVAASALTGGFFVFMLFLIMATALLANPLRHFEVYLGQWSISGPGRAYRVLPVFEGIGLAICINAFVRAILCTTVAAIAAIYVVCSASDSRLPFTYCRDFDLNPYDPILNEFNFIMLSQPRLLWNNTDLMDENVIEEHVTVGTQYLAWRKETNNIPVQIRAANVQKLEVCNENYSVGYPIVYHRPEYNFFYVEVVLYREDGIIQQFNIPLSVVLGLIWSIFWIILLTERLTHQRLIWNNTYSWLVVVPWIWTALLLITALAKFSSIPKTVSRLSKIGAKEVLDSLTDAFQVAMYIHSASIGSEIITGKGLNHYAMGHIDPHLNEENIWHSGLLVLLAGLHSGGAMICTLTDDTYGTNKTYHFLESTLWIFPLYSKCTLVRNYSHVLSMLIFSGITFSYLSVAFILVKTALHTIFEYKVKLVFAEHAVIAVTILSCMGLNLIFATTSGVALLESIDAIMTGIAMPFICLLEVAPMLYVYRGHDFLSDMHLATEENACSSRIGTQWLFIPMILLVIIVMKTSMLLGAEMPASFTCAATATLAAAVLAPLLRAVRNAYKFVRAMRRAK